MERKISVICGIENYFIKKKIEEIESILVIGIIRLE